MSLRPLLSLLVLFLLSEGCAGSKVHYQEVFRDDTVHVRLAETRAKSGEVMSKGFDHPWDVDLWTLEKMLESVRYRKRNVLVGAGQPQEAFPPSSRHALLKPLQTAFAQAGPNQAVDFSFTCERSTLKIFRRVYLTDGILFRKEERLNIAFRNLAFEETGVEEEAEPNREDPTVSPARTSWTLVAGEGQTLARAQGSGLFGSTMYTNWVQLEVSWPWGESQREGMEEEVKGPAKALESGPPSDPGVSDPAFPRSRQEAKERLEFLEELYREGAIPEDSYRDKKRELIQLLETLP